MAAQPANSRDSAPASALRAPKPLLAVAIDFGTYASGFAYAPIPQHQPQPCQPHAVPRVSLHTAWPGQPAPDPKTRTAVLYRGRTLVSGVKQILPSKWAPYWVMLGYCSPRYSCCHN